MAVLLTRILNNEFCHHFLLNLGSSIRPVSTRHAVFNFYRVTHNSSLEFVDE